MELAMAGQKEMKEIVLRQRLSQVDAHYGGDLVDGARILGLFGDAATALLIGHDGDEGLFRAYEAVEFLAPVYAGDFIEVRAEITEVGKTSRRMNFAAYKIISPTKNAAHPSAADWLKDPLPVVTARGTCVVPAACQRIKR